MKNNKVIKIIAIIGGALAILGIVLICATFPYNGSYDDIFNSDLIIKLNDDKIIEDTSEVETINIKSCLDIKVETTTEDNFMFKSNGEVIYISPFNNNFSTSCYVTDKKLIIDYSIKHFFSLISIFDAEITLLVPESYTGEININSTIGDIEFKATNKFKKAKFNITTGTVNGAINAETVELNLTTGDVDFDKLVCDSLVANLTTGCLTVNSAQCKQAQISLTTGDANVNFTEINEINANVTTGSLYLNFPTKDYIRLNFSRATGELINHYLKNYPSRIERNVTMIQGSESSANKLTGTLSLTTGSITIS